MGCEGDLQQHDGASGSAGAQRTQGECLSLILTQKIMHDWCGAGADALLRRAD